MSINGDYRGGQSQFQRWKQTILRLKWASKERAVNSAAARRVGPTFSTQGIWLSRAQPRRHCCRGAVAVTDGHLLRHEDLQNIEKFVDAALEVLVGGAQ